MRRSRPSPIPSLYGGEYIAINDEPNLLVILNLFQDLSAEKDKKRLAVRC